MEQSYLLYITANGVFWSTIPNVEWRFKALLLENWSEKLEYRQPETHELKIVTLAIVSIYIHSIYVHPLIFVCRSV